VIVVVVVVIAVIIAVIIIIIVVVVVIYLANIQRTKRAAARIVTHHLSHTHRATAACLSGSS
jgi:hypothetical protein